ncbi:R-phycoerythrin gamma chain, chloroplastic [Gracilariopsis chorda]|uniref:R-phycoerythrin gamma chain, chloroplastic n=1 Tax=Gracilariopsis chorda TaxID=448386 RepID=A0A2V3IFJ9_9FLOR|nr:R-phycoerythrin gamma chain, chloroplastic [Gracilariopsis chorda]|eukprot:PXF39950.1 R-phycoerythrin gamma chain, chloroplastic [Gracilariopsis chorda]
MDPAFMLSSIKPVSLGKSFTGAALSCPRTLPRALWTMEKYSLDKYTKMSTPPESPPPGPSKPSAQWVSFTDSLKEKFSPFRGKSTKVMANYSQSALTVSSTPFFLIQGKVSTMPPFKGDPDTTINRNYMQDADRYMAQCITMQYKMTAAPLGVYNVQCTEGTIRGQAEDARNLALSTSFRMKQRTVSQKFADYTETRRKALIGAHGCTYEEKLLAKFPISARAYVRSGAEAKSTCTRYANGATAAEKYMAACVDKQSMSRLVPTGVYGVTCNDGNTKQVAEYKRVQALAAKFRANQQPSLVKESIKFESAKYARDYFGHLCSYEESLFNSFPAVAASMRPSISY